MSWTIFIIFLVLWLVGALVGVTNPYLHLLLVAAIVTLLVGLVATPEEGNEMAIDMVKLGSGREVCPKCGKKGLGYANHPHAFGHKDYDRAACRYCHARFKLTSGGA